MTKNLGFRTCEAPKAGQSDSSPDSSLFRSFLSSLSDFKRNLTKDLVTSRDEVAECNKQDTPPPHNPLLECVGEDTAAAKSVWFGLSVTGYCMSSNSV